MKNILDKGYRLGHITLSFILGFLPRLAGAQDVSVENEEDIARALGNIFNFFYSIFFAFAAFSFLYGAYLFLAGGGDPEKVKTAKKVMTYSMVAVVVAILALGMDNIIRDLISG